ncbi:MAG: signal peptidase I [Bacilli bacterium]|nr:signal peptidase I [Bacilli bacterium]
MPDDYMQEKFKVVGAVQPAKRKTNWWVIFLDLFAIVSFLLIIAVSGNVIFLSQYYGEPFYVNGMSMYPTLNKDALIYDTSKNSYRASTMADGSNKVKDYVDYGWARYDEDGNWLKDLHRYDIVITYFKSDFDSSGKLLSNTSLKIKRLIGFPGETVKLEADDGSPAWGKTTITLADGSSEVLPNLYTSEDFGSATYTMNKSRVGTWTLGPNEYFVMGDNRAGSNSKDSRWTDVGPIKETYMRGKAYVITGLRLLKEEDGSLAPKFDLWKIRFPWNYIHLEYKQ